MVTQKHAIVERWLWERHLLGALPPSLQLTAVSLGSGSRRETPGSLPVRR